MYGIYVQTESGIISGAVQTCKTQAKAEAEADKMMKRMTEFHKSIYFKPPTFTLIVKPYHVNKLD